MQLQLFLKDANPHKLPFRVITGWGKHARNVEFAMQTAVIEYVRVHLPDWSATQDRNNVGRLFA